MDKKYLYFDEKEIEIIFKNVFTGKLRTDILQTIKDFTEDETLQAEKMKIAEEIIKAKKSEIEAGNVSLSDIDSQVALKVISSGAMDIKKIFEKDEGNYLEMIYTLAAIIIDAEKTCKIIKYENIKENLKEILNGKISENLEFWDNQDIEMLEEKINFFRSKIKRAI